MNLNKIQILIIRFYVQHIVQQILSAVYSKLKVKFQFQSLGIAVYQVSWWPLITEMQLIINLANCIFSLIDFWTDGHYVLLSWGTTRLCRTTTTCPTGKSSTGQTVPHELRCKLYRFLSFPTLSAGCLKVFHSVEWNDTKLTHSPIRLHQQVVLLKQREEVSGRDRLVSILHFLPCVVKRGLPILRVAERLKLCANLMSAWMWLHFFLSCSTAAV